MTGFMCVIWLIQMCDMAHSYVRHDTFICVTWLRHDTFICVTWLIHVCNITRHHHLREWHYSLIWVTWLIHMCYMTYVTCHTYERAMLHTCWYVWHESFTWVTLLIDLSDVTHSYVWHDSFICVRHESFIRVPWLIYRSDITPAFRNWMSMDMGWLRLLGSKKLQVSFAKETYKRDNILQKRPIILSILRTVATPWCDVLQEWRHYYKQEWCHSYINESW